ELRDLGGQALNLDIAQHRLQDAAVHHADGLADEVQRYRDGETFGQVDLDEVGVEDGAADRMPLHLAQQDHLVVQVAVAGGEEPDQVRALEVRQLVLEFLGADADRDGVALRAVEDARNDAGATQTPGLPLTATAAPLDRDVHSLHATSSLR